MTDARAPVDSAKFWNSRATDFSATLDRELDRFFAPVTAATLAAAQAQCGERVIDIGCGSGSTVIELARLVGPAGRVVGADISENSVAHARERIVAAGLSQAEVVLADVATHRFAPGSFDLAFSRFGVMFFPDPVAAFANLRSAMAPGGRLAFAVFRAVQENPWNDAPIQAVRHVLPPIAPLPPGTGMWSWADAARVRVILEGAGFAMHVGQGARVLIGADEATRAAVRDGFEKFFARHDSPAGIALPGAIWVVTAKV